MSSSIFINFSKAELASVEQASSGLSSDICSITLPLLSLSSLLALLSDVILSCWQILWKIWRRLPCWIIGGKSSWNWSEPLSVDRSDLAVLRVRAEASLPASKELSLLLLYVVSFVKLNVSSKVPSGAHLLSANTSAAVMLIAAKCAI